MTDAREWLRTFVDEAEREPLAAEPGRLYPVPLLIEMPAGCSFGRCEMMPMLSGLTPVRLNFERPARLLRLADRFREYEQDELGQSFDIALMRLDAYPFAVWAGLDGRDMNRPDVLRGQLLLTALT